VWKEQAQRSSRSEDTVPIRSATNGGNAQAVVPIVRATRSTSAQCEQQPEPVAARTVENSEMGSGSQCSGGRQEPRPAAVSSATPGIDLGAARCRLSSISPSFDETMSWQT
jgi:hypothetical protein